MCHGVPVLIATHAYLMAVVGVPVSSMILPRKTGQFLKNHKFFKAVRMVFACQKDSFLQEYKTTVVSCESAKLGDKEGFEVVLEDTILFPEGGGQPDDRGTINGKEVVRITRRQEEAVHFVEESIPVGTEVELKVDWTRRFDHMQQHSGQHLISALLENKFGYKTVSWELGRQKSHVELNCKSLSKEEMAWVEDTANAEIRRHVPVNVHIYANKNAPELDEAQTRGLPDDYNGPIRVIEIEGIDKNMCCGTHVPNLSYIQAVKFFPDTEAMRGGCRLYFLVGNRVFKHLDRAMENERVLSKSLSCGPDEHTGAVERIQNSIRSSNRTLRSQLKEIAQLEAFKIKSTFDGKRFIFIHRENGDMDYMNTISNELSGLGVPLLITVGPDKGPGQFVFIGTEKQVAELGPKISSLLDGKGGGKKTRFQGKVNTLKPKIRKSVNELLEEFTSLSVKPDENSH